DLWARAARSASRETEHRFRLGVRSNSGSSGSNRGSHMRTGRPTEKPKRVPITAGRSADVWLMTLLGRHFSGWPGVGGRTSKESLRRFVVFRRLAGPQLSRVGASG